ANGGSGGVMVNVATNSPSGGWWQAVYARVASAPPVAPLVARATQPATSGADSPDFRASRTLPVRRTNRVPAGSAVSARAHPKCPDVVGRTQSAMTWTRPECHWPPRYTVASTVQARLACAYIRLCCSAASVPVACFSLSTSCGSTCPTWYTSAVWAAAQSTAAPGQGNACRAAVSSTVQHEDGAGAPAGGFAVPAAVARGRLSQYAPARMSASATANTISPVQRRGIRSP